MIPNILGTSFRYTNRGNVYLKKNNKHIGELSYFYYKNDYVYITQLRIFRPFMNKGYGTRVMKFFCKFLDKNNYKAELCAHNNYDCDVSLTDSQLIKFYKKFGFKTKDKKHKMIRLPKVYK